MLVAGEVLLILEELSVFISVYPWQRVAYLRPAEPAASSAAEFFDRIG
jgi:hypothetical protein